MSKPDELFEELWSMEYRICGNKDQAKMFARDFLNRHIQALTETQREAHNLQRPSYHMGQPCHPQYLCHVEQVISSIEQPDEGGQSCRN